MKFEIKISARELFYFSMCHTYSTFAGLSGTIFSVFCLVVLVATWGTVALNYTFLLAVCALLFTVWNPISLWGKAKRQARAEVFAKPLAYQLDEKGIQVTQGDQTADYGWDYVFKARQVKKAFFIYTDPIHAFILPKEQLGGKDMELASLLKDKAAGKCKGIK